MLPAIHKRQTRAFTRILHIRQRAQLRSRQMLGALGKFSGRFRAAADRPDMVIVSAVSRALKLSTGTSRCARIDQPHMLMIAAGSRGWNHLVGTFRCALRRLAQDGDCLVSFKREARAA